MSEARLKATAKIQVLVEIDAPGIYSEQFNMGELHNQARREALKSLLDLIIVKNGSIRVIGKPKVISTAIEAPER